MMIKKLSVLLAVFSCFFLVFAQEINANVVVNSQQTGDNNQQVYKTLQKSLRDFINNTSWTGKNLRNFEKIRANFGLVIAERNGNRFKGTLLIQAVRPVYGSTYESPLLNLNDTKVEFEYLENENLIFNERQFSGKNLTDIVSFYIYTILGYDGDSFRPKGGQEWFMKAQKISQNAQNQGFTGWSEVEGPKTRATFINSVLNENSGILRNVYYTYHRAGLDNLAGQDNAQPKKIIADALTQLRFYENNFQMNPAFSNFIEAKKDEIYNIFSYGNNGNVKITDLTNLMTTFDPKDTDSMWSKWK